MLITKAATLDRGNPEELQSYNKLQKEYKSLLFNEDTFSKTTVAPADLGKQFKKIQSDLIRNDSIGNFKIGESAIEKEIPSTDVKDFYKQITGE